MLCAWGNKELQPGALKQQKLTVSQFLEARYLRPGCQLGWLVPFGGSEAESIVCLSPGIWGFADNLWRFFACLCACLSLCPNSFPSFKDVSHIGLGPTLMTLSLTMIPRPMKVILFSYWVLGLQSMNWGREDTIQSITHGTTTLEKGWEFLPKLNHILVLSPRNSTPESWIVTQQKYEWHGQDCS